MRRTTSIISGTLLLASALVPATVVAQGDCVTTFLPAGRTISAVPAETICGSFAEVDDEIEYRVDEPVVINGLTVIAKDAVIRGVVTEAESNGRGGGGGKLVIELATVTDVRGGTIDLDGGPATVEIIGSSRGFFGKLFTLWLGKGEDACVDPFDEPLDLQTGEAASVCVYRNSGDR